MQRKFEEIDEYTYGFTYFWDGEILWCYYPHNIEGKIKSIITMEDLESYVKAGMYKEIPV